MTPNRVNKAHGPTKENVQNVGVLKVRKKLREIEKLKQRPLEQLEVPWILQLI